MTTTASRGTSCSDSALQQHRCNTVMGLDSRYPLYPYAAASRCDLRDDLSELLMPSFFSCLLIGGSTGLEADRPPPPPLAPFTTLPRWLIIVLPRPPNEVLLLLLLLLLLLPRIPLFASLLPGDARGLPRGLPRLLRDRAPAPSGVRSFPALPLPRPLLPRTDFWRAGAGAPTRAAVTDRRAPLRPDAAFMILVTCARCFEFAGDLFFAPSTCCDPRMSWIFCAYFNASMWPARCMRGRGRCSISGGGGMRTEDTCARMAIAIVGCGMTARLPKP